MSRVGIEVTADTIRGVVTPSWRNTPTRTFELAWDPTQPALAVPALRNEVASPDALFVAIGLAFVHVARVQLPPSAPEAREAMVQLEPQRFFLANEPLRASLGARSDVAFAVDAAWLEALEGALGSWAPIARVEPSPLALVAALPAATSGTYTLAAFPDGAATLDVRDGALATVRRGTSVDVGAGRALPNSPVAGTHLAALGAVLRDDDALVGTLLTTTQRGASRRRVVQGVATAAFAAIAGLAFLGMAAHRARDRELAALEATAARLTSDARPALDAQARLASRQRETQEVKTLQAERADPAAALAAIGAILPRDVVLLSARAKGNDWQIDGTARDAAALVPLLDADSRFDSVRSLSASSRFRDGGSARESFSIALHVRPAP